jgi:hypothetical protein
MKKWKMFFPIVENNEYNYCGIKFETPYKRIKKEIKKNNNNNNKNCFCC